MVIGEGIVDILAIPPRGDEFALSQNTQLMGDSGSTHPQTFRKVRHAELPLVQSPENLETGTVSKHLKKVRKIADILIPQQRFSEMAAISLHDD